jgi:hypothetical protein
LRQLMPAPGARPLTSVFILVTRPAFPSSTAA